MCLDEYKIKRKDGEPMLDFGMPTLLELDGLEANAKFCHELGLKFVEINMNVPDFQVEALDRGHLLELMEQYKIYFTFHMADNMDIANFQEEVRRVNVELVIKTLEFADSIGSPLVNMHMQKGVYFTMPTEKIYIYQKYIERYMTYVDSFGERIEKELKDKKVFLGVENTGDFDREFMRAGTLNLIERPNIVMTYDIGHDYSFGNDRGFIIEHLEKIRHMHIHDAIGIDHHLALGSGEMQLERYIGFAKNYHVRCVIEAKTIEALKKSVSELPKYM